MMIVRAKEKYVVIVNILDDRGVSVSKEIIRRTESIKEGGNDVTSSNSNCVMGA